MVSTKYTRWLSLTRINESSNASTTTVGSIIPCIGEITSDRNVMDPWLESLVEEFLPVSSNLKHQRSAEKEVFIAKTSSHATEIKQVPT